MSNFIQPVVVILIKKENKYLLTVRAEEGEKENNFHGYWQIAGGGLEFGESVEECAIREAKEELGVDVEIVRMLPKIYHDTRGRWHGIFIAFECSMKDDAEIVLNEESSEYGWFTLEEAKKLKMMPLCIEVLELLS
jgi:NAD+ diphosphatase